MKIIKKIDVIIPLYETPISYIRSTLLSIANQRIIDKIRVTIIDDCSNTDYSSIVELFSNLMDLNYIKLPVNKGVGYARQYGIDHTKNEYITFIDSDDSLYSEYSLELLFNEIQKKKYDFVSGNFIREYISDESEDISSNMLPLSHLRLGKIEKNATWVFSRLFSRQFLVSNNIYFNDMRFNEDVSFMQLALCQSENNTHINNTIYVQHCNMESITRSKNGDYTDNVNGLIKFVEALSYSHIRKRELGIVTTDKSKIQICDGLSVCYWYLVKCIHEYSTDDCELFLKELQKYYNLVIEDFADIYHSNCLIESYFSSIESMSEISKIYIPRFSFLELLDDLEANKNEIIYDEDCKYQLG